MANYQPKVNLAWKYIQNAQSPNPNLKIVWSVEVSLAAGEQIQFSRASLKDTVINLGIGGTKTDSFSEEWDAPFTVDYGLAENQLNRDKIKGQIQVNTPIKVITMFLINGVVEGETINQSTQNAKVEWA